MACFAELGPLSEGVVERLRMVLTRYSRVRDGRDWYCRIIHIHILFHHVGVL